MDKINELTEQFTKFPGVGPRQARRMVFYLLRTRRDWVTRFTNDILHLKDSVQQCIACGRHFSPLEHSSETHRLCTICADDTREPTIMIVEKDVDLENIEKSRIYHGTYFVLGGLYAPLATDPFGYMRMHDLTALIEERMSAKRLVEVVIALAVNPDGEETAHVLEEKLKPLFSATSCSLTHLGRGLSTGSELEYADPETIKHAFRSRY